MLKRLTAGGPIRPELSPSPPYKVSNPRLFLQSVAFFDLPTVALDMTAFVLPS
jgi:hypothetical protein